MSNNKRILIIDDEKNMRHMLKSLLCKHNYNVVTAGNGIEALDVISAAQNFDFILCDVRMPEMDGLEFLAECQRRDICSTIIMMSAFGSIDLAVEAMKKGASDYISKPFKTDEVLLTLKKAEQRKFLQGEDKEFNRIPDDLHQIKSFEGMIGESEAMLSFFQLAEKVARFDTTALVLGESGTGKELVARGIHNVSKRREYNFVAVNCGSIPENLLESELFGYEKGAFTGADKNKKGLFEEANNGTIFLDEIAELPVSMQVKLLRVLQEKEIRPIGANKAKSVNVRIVAATSVKLKDAIREGKFREDLFFRLNVLYLQVPPLREREGDLPLLCRHFIEKYSKAFGCPEKTISSEVYEKLIEHKWPGNVRELENLIQRSLIMSEGKELRIEELNLIYSNDNENALDFGNDYSLKIAQKKMEATHIREAMVKSKGNKSMASRLLGISYPSLLKKIKEYNI